MYDRDTHSSKSNTLNSLLLALIFSVIHGLAVWWCIRNTSSGFWVMEGGNASLRESVADLMTIVLNFPGGLLGYRLAPNKVVLLIFIIINSCLWGACTALAIAIIRRVRRVKMLNQ